MRSELLQRIQDLLGNEDLEAVRTDVRNSIQSFHALTQDEVRKHRELWEKEEHEPDESFIYIPTEEDSKFEELAASFKEREKAYKAKISEEQKANLVLKKELLQELIKTIQEEENIGKAFGAFNEVREKWEAIGDVPGNNYKEVHDEYHRLRDEFFYNINIYKQLQDHDLQINLKKKQELTLEAGKLPEIEDLKEREKTARELQKRWLDIGPSPRETYREMADVFFGITKPVFDEVKAHYEKIKEGFVANKDLKEALITELASVIPQEDVEGHKAWQALTSKVIELQKRWKDIGFAGKEHNEAMWTKFRDVADQFFSKKQAYYDVMKEEGKGAKLAKMALIEKAEALNDSTDWRDTTQAMLQLQQEWKGAGSCPPGDEHRLWRKFHKAQDVFFKAKKTQFADRNKEEKVNQVLKNTLLETVESFALTGDRGKDIEVLKEFSTEWRAIGFVPRKAVQALSDRFSKAMDKHYDALSVDRAERAISNYSHRVDKLSRSGGNDLVREQSILRDKIQRLNTRISQTEENMARFTGKGAVSIHQLAEKSIKGYRLEIDEIKAKLKLLREAADV